MAEPSQPMIAPPAEPISGRALGSVAIASSSVGVAHDSGWLPRSLAGAHPSAEKARLCIVDSSSEEPLLDTAQ
jgi:hypothetical protein